MRPFPIDMDSHYKIDYYNVDWEYLVTQCKDYKNGDFDYITNISKYPNNGGIPGGIYAKGFLYKEDTEFNRLLSMIHRFSLVQNDFIPLLFIKTSIKNYIKEFETEPDRLYDNLKNAHFEYVNPFDIQGELAKFLFYYGMYDYYYKHYSANKASETAQEFMISLFGTNLENVVIFKTRHPWGKWFDVHSCTDCTFVFINISDRIIHLFCFSHSD